MANCISNCISAGSKAAASPLPRDGFGKWVQLPTSGDAPSPRSGHDVVVVGCKAYLFGGCGGHSANVACLNDVHVFDLRTHHWDTVRVKGESPLPRASFAACAGTRPGTMIVSGGTGVEVDSLRADLMEFNTNTRTWASLASESDRTPCRLYGQSIVAYGDSLLLFGGSTGLHYTNDLHEYSMALGRWRRVITHGVRPSLRYKHQAVVAGDVMYVIGGGCFKPEDNAIDVHCLDLKTLQWTKLDAWGEIPPSRVAHTCSLDSGGTTLYMWGGFTSELSRLSDFYALDLISQEWRAVAPPPAAAPASQRQQLAATTQPEAGEAADAAAEQQQAQPEGTAQQRQPAGEEGVDMPPARAFHAAAFFEGSLYVFSGANGDVRYSDVWRYELGTAPPALGVLAAHALRAAGAPQWTAAARALPRELAAAVVGMNTFATRLP